MQINNAKIIIKQLAILGLKVNLTSPGTSVNAKNPAEVIYLFSVVPTGLIIIRTGFPPINRWAIIICPYGTYISAAERHSQKTFIINSFRTGRLPVFAMFFGLLAIVSI